MSRHGRFLKKKSVQECKTVLIKFKGKRQRGIRENEVHALVIIRKSKRTYHSNPKDPPFKEKGHGPYTKQLREGTLGPIINMHGWYVYYGSKRAFP